MQLLSSVRDNNVLFASNKGAEHILHGDLMTSLLFISANDWLFQIGKICISPYTITVLEIHILKSNK